MGGGGWGVGVGGWSKFVYYESKFKLNFFFWGGGGGGGIAGGRGGGYRK